MTSRIPAEEITERNQGEEITERDKDAGSPRGKPQAADDRTEMELHPSNEKANKPLTLYDLIKDPDRFLVKVESVLVGHYPNETNYIKDHYGDTVLALPKARIDGITKADGNLPREHLSNEMWTDYNLKWRTKLPFEITTDETRFILSADLLRNIELDGEGHILKEDNATSNISTATSGGNGLVLTAYDVKMGEEVIVKILNHIGSRESMQVASFLKEARLLAHISDVERRANLSIESPRARTLGFLPVNTAGEILPFIVMDKMPGIPLTDEVISTQEALEIGDRIAQYVDTMNAEGIFYLDVKPSNILYDRKTNKLALLDWGIVKGGYRGTIMNRISDLYTRDDSPRGTPNYISPEELYKSPTEFSNQHQLAVTVFNLMNGQQSTLWTEDTAAIANLSAQEYANRDRDKMHTDKTQYLPKPEWMSEDVYQVFLKATSYMPEERYNSCQEFMEELRKAFDKRS